MLSTIFSAIIIFIATNIDDILVLMLFRPAISHIATAGAFLKKTPTRMTAGG